MMPEFSRPEPLDAIGTEPRVIAIEADEDERRRLAARFGLVAIERLAARFTLRRDAGTVLAEGHVEACLTQSCAVTDEPLAAVIEEGVTLRFVEPSPTGEEIELSDDEIDTIDLEGNTIDLGEAAAETMALALDLYPRGPGAAEALRAAGMVSEEEATRPGKLAGLKALLGGGDA